MPIFEYHAHVRLRFKLASGLGVPWTRDGGIPQVCPLSMMFVVALYLLAALHGIEASLLASESLWKLGVLYPYGGLVSSSAYG